MSIATCPKCHRQVSLPTTDDHSIWVRCPLCGGQYPLRTALDHVPPSLEILGPDQAAGDVVPLQAEVAGTGEMHPAADTLAHPEYGATIPPLEADPFQHGEQGSIGLHSPDQSDAPHEDISEHLLDFEIETPPGQFDAGMIGHSETPVEGASAAPEMPSAEPQHAFPISDELLPIDPAAAAFSDFHPEQHFTADADSGDLPVDFMAEPAPEPGSEHAGSERTGSERAGSEHTEAEPMFEPTGGPIGTEPLGSEPLASHELSSHEFGGEHTGEEHVAGEQAAHEMFGGEQFAIEDFAGGLPAGEHAIGEHPVGGDFGGEHPSSEHIGAEPIAGEHFGDGEPEFQFAADEAPEHAEAGTDEERAAMGGIASMVESAPPAKKRRHAPLAARVVGVLIAVVLGIVGCYIVLGAFLMLGNGEARGLASHLHLKPFYPGFVSSHIPDETASSRRPNIPPARTNPQQSTASNGAAATAPAKPGPSAVAQQSPAKSTAGLETFEDANKAPPSDLEKPDMSKPNSTLIAPPKLDAPKSPFDETPKAPAKSSAGNPAATAPNAATPATQAAPAPNNLATNVSPIQSGVTNPVPTTPPISTAPAEKTAEKPVISSPEKSAENDPFAPATKSPLADRLAEIDVALNNVKQSAENVKSTATPGADPLTVLRAKAANYRAMSHLATALATIQHLPHDPTFAARIEKLRDRTAAFAEAMGSPAERDTTALIAGKWIALPTRKENGVLIVGTLSKVDPSSQGFAAHVQPPNGAKEMTFTSATKPNVADGSTVVVLGLLDADKNGGTAVEIVPAANQPAANPAVAPAGPSATK